METDGNKKNSGLFHSIFGYGGVHEMDRKTHTAKARGIEIIDLFTICKNI